MKDEFSPEALEVDLFGQVIEPIRDRRGRPAFAKSKENQDFVAVRAANGWSHKRIAEALGCDDDTLRKHFSGELNKGRLIVEGMILDVLMRKIREGHTPSIRLMQERMKDSAPAAPRAAATDEKEKAAPLGKKEKRILEAGKVPDDWGDIDAGRKQ